MALIITIVLLDLGIMLVFKVLHYLNALHRLCVRLAMNAAFLATFYSKGKFSNVPIGRISFCKVVIKGRLTAWGKQYRQSGPQCEGNINSG